MEYDEGEFRKKPEIATITQIKTVCDFEDNVSCES